MASAAPECETANGLTAELGAVFENHGYAAAELARRFGAGARGFAIERAGHVAAACFVSPNFGPVWEIAGVHTLPGQRRQGLA